jgi:tetratricopeptide (TPR) repeat protein
MRALALAGTALVASPAAAQTPSERALAESLFREGKELLTKGDTAAACRKLEESHRLDPVGGTLLNLATCHEKERKIATAWAEYQSALELAKRASRRDRIALAQRKVDELAPRVPYLTITIEGAAPPGLHVELDGVALGEASRGRGWRSTPAITASSSPPTGESRGRRR